MEEALKKENLKQPFWAMSVAETNAVLKVSTSGLSPDEAKNRLDTFGPNELQEKSSASKLKIFLNQIASPLILLLIVAGGITTFLELWIETGVIFAAVAVNTALGFWQENKSEHVLQLLRSFIRVRARVRRNGKEQEIDSKEIVPGDLIRVTQGDRVPADARIIFSKSFEVDESILTGESLPVEKNSDALPASTGLADRASMIFGGTLAVAGFADAVITASGSHTEMGKIAELTHSKKSERTPLQQSILSFTIKASIALAVLATALFVFGIYYGVNVFEMFLIAVSVAVSAVPEGLPIALTVILAVGVQRLSYKKGVVRKLLAAETLGSTTLVLTDKTGTLTQARMELKDADPETLREALAGIDVVIENPEAHPDQWNMFGNHLEMALVRGAAKRGIMAHEQYSKIEIIDRLPFNSEQKYSAAIYTNKNSTRLVLLGAPDILLDLTNLSLEEKFSKMEAINREAALGKRILGVVSRELKVATEHSFKSVNLANLEFKGILTFHDPLRPTTKEAIQKIKSFGVKTKIVTGDHPGTAEAVARELGLITSSEEVIAGKDLAALTPEELVSRADRINVFARVTPEQKIMLTKLYKEKGEIVALTGDGINDAPAIKEADIGIAVGSGTDVAKNAADLVLLEDNFETIVAAIEEGRRILDNIRKVIVYLLSSVFDELLLIGGALLFGVALPLSALQILFVNFFSDSFPAIAFAFEKNIDGSGKAPRKLKQGLLDSEMKFLILAIGIATSILLFGLYYVLLKKGFDPHTVRTFIFASFATYTLLLAFSVRSLKKSIFSYNPFSNKHLVAGSGIGIILTALAVYLPALQNIFNTKALALPWVFGIVGVGIANILAIEVGKWLYRNTSQ